MDRRNDDAVQAYVNDGWKVVEGIQNIDMIVRIYKENENVSDENLHQHEYEIANDYWQLRHTIWMKSMRKIRRKPIEEFAFE